MFYQYKLSNDIECLITELISINHDSLKATIQVFQKKMIIGMKTVVKQIPQENDFAYAATNKHAF